MHRFTGLDNTQTEGTWFRPLLVLGNGSSLQLEGFWGGFVRSTAEICLQKSSLLHVIECVQLQVSPQCTGTTSCRLTTILDESGDHMLSVQTFTEGADIPEAACKAQVTSASPAVSHLSGSCWSSSVNCESLEECRAEVHKHNPGILKVLHDALQSYDWVIH